MEQNLRLGDKLDLVVGSVSCLSKLMEITAAGTLIVAEPLFRSPIAAGDNLTLIYYRQTGMYSCTVKTLRKLLDRKRGLAMLEVEIRSPVTKYQRREFVRFSINLPVKLTPIAYTEDLAFKSAEQIVKDYAFARDVKGIVNTENQVDATIMDLSGGGLRMGSDKRIGAGTVLECTFSMRGEIMQPFCQVLSTDDTEGIPRYRLGCRYTGLLEKQRTKIIRFIFEEQSRRLRKDE